MVNIFKNQLRIRLNKGSSNNYANHVYKHKLIGEKRKIIYQRMRCDFMINIQKITPL